MPHPTTPNPAIPDRGKDGITPLMAACASARTSSDIARILKVLDAGADPAAADCHGNTAMHYALEGEGPVNPRRWEVVALLVRKGADPGARNARGKSPLHLALDCLARGRSLDMFLGGVELLMVNGADLLACDDEGRSPAGVLLARGPGFSSPRLVAMARAALLGAGIRAAPAAPAPDKPRL